LLCDYARARAGQRAARSIAAKMREGQTNGLGTVGIAHEQLVARQHGYGCTVLILDSGAVAPELILYRVK